MTSVSAQGAIDTSTAALGPAAKPASTAGIGRIGQIDALRAFAMTAVIAQHCGILPFGWLGVWLFFVISGFVVTESLMARKDISGIGRRLFQFYVRRIARIWPIYLIFLCCGVRRILVGDRTTGLAADAVPHRVLQQRRGGVRRWLFRGLAVGTALDDLRRVAVLYRVRPGVRSCAEAVPGSGFDGLGGPVSASEALRRSLARDPLFGRRHRVRDLHLPWTSFRRVCHGRAAGHLRTPFRLEAAGEPADACRRSRPYDLLRGVRFDQRRPRREGDQPGHQRDFRNLFRRPARGVSVFGYRLGVRRLGGHRCRGWRRARHHSATAMATGGRPRVLRRLHLPFGGAWFLALDHESDGVPPAGSARRDRAWASSNSPSPCRSRSFSPSAPIAGSSSP